MPTLQMLSGLMNRLGGLFWCRLKILSEVVFMETTGLPFHQTFKWWNRFNIHQQLMVVLVILRLIFIWPWRNSIYGVGDSNRGDYASTAYAAHISNIRPALCSHYLEVLLKNMVLELIMNHSKMETNSHVLGFGAKSLLLYKHKGENEFSLTLPIVTRLRFEALRPLLGEVYNKEMKVILRQRWANAFIIDGLCWWTITLLKNWSGGISIK